MTMVLVYWQQQQQQPQERAKKGQGGDVAAGDGMKIRGRGCGRRVYGPEGALYRYDGHFAVARACSFSSMSSGRHGWHGIRCQSYQLDCF